MLTCGSGRPSYVAFSILVKSLPVLTSCPVSLLRPSEFENANTLHQLRCGGVLEAVRISCAGYPTKTLYPDFVDHFWNLAPQLLSTDMDDEGIAEAILQKTGLKVRGAVCSRDAWTVGRSTAIKPPHAATRHHEIAYCSWLPLPRHGCALFGTLMIMCTGDVAGSRKWQRPAVGKSHPLIRLTGHVDGMFSYHPLLL